MDFLSGDECTYSSHLHVNVWWALLAKTNPTYIKNVLFSADIFFNMEQTENMVIMTVWATVTWSIAECSASLLPDSSCLSLLL